jgi:outer membrane protein insertion porin family
MYRGSAEVKLPIGAPKEWGLFGTVFIDVGASWKPGQSSVSSLPAGSKAPQILDSKAPRVSAGPGILWTSPFGPIGVFYAMPIKKKYFDQTRRFFISFSSRF